MIVISPAALSKLMTDIVMATHGLEDINGNRTIVGTISPEAIRSAALVAVQVACGDAVWPGDRQIVLPRKEFSHGLFREG